MKIHLPNVCFEDLKSHSVLQILLFLTEEKFSLISTQKQGKIIITLGVFKKIRPKTKTEKLDEN